MLQIRAFDKHDQPALEELWSAVFADDPAWNAPAALIARKLTVQPELLLVALLDGRLVGAVMAGFDGVRGWIYHLAVAPDARRRGVGRQLIRAAEARLRDLGCPKVNLQVRASNRGVVEFYNALGYRSEERVSMGRRLTADDDGLTNATVREFRDGDEPALYAVFHASIHGLAARHYTPEQLAAWAPEQPESERWTEKMRARRPFVVEEGGRILGYADVQSSGLIDHFFVSAADARRGVGRLLMERIHARATELQVDRLYADVSLTAEPFFQRFGFRVVERKLAEVRGARLPNARMVKDLASR
ncbi:MAG TPA: GNAT family acetyltransferase [Polyangia bacterium]|nr:GNAT family acetyltransferase [Polyangia bacterium]